MRLCRHTVRKGFAFPAEFIPNPALRLRLNAIEA